MNESKRFWQHDETGRIVYSDDPGPRWYVIPTMYEDELPADIDDEEYDWWYGNSVLDGVRIGPDITCKS